MHPVMWTDLESTVLSERHPSQMVIDTHRSSDLRSVPIGPSTCLFTRLSCPWSSRLSSSWHSVKVMVNFHESGHILTVLFFLCKVDDQVSSIQSFALLHTTLSGHPWVGHNICIFSSCQHTKMTHLGITSIFFLLRPFIMRDTTSPTSMLSQLRQGHSYYCSEWIGSGPHACAAFLCPLTGLILDQTCISSFLGGLLLGLQDLTISWVR